MTPGRIISLLVAIAYIGAAGLRDPASGLQVLGYLVLPMLCIWFPEILANRSGLGVLFSGAAFTRGVPEPVVKLVGWCFLFLPLVFLAVGRWAESSAP